MGEVKQRQVTNEFQRYFTIGSRKSQPANILTSKYIQLDTAVKMYPNENAKYGDTIRISGETKSTPHVDEFRGTNYIYNVHTCTCVCVHNRPFLLMKLLLTTHMYT